MLPFSSFWNGRVRKRGDDLFSFFPGGMMEG